MCEGERHRECDKREMRKMVEKKVHRERNFDI